MADTQNNESYPMESSHSQSPAVEHGDPTTGTQVTAHDVFEARQKLQQLRIKNREHLRATIQDPEFNPENLPSLQELREERVRLTEQIRHHKDEQDSLALDIESQEGTAEVYQIAARVQRFEHFAAHAYSYVNETLPAEIEQIIEADAKHSEEEVASYVQDLQKRRERVVNSIAAAQHPAKRKNTDEAVPLDDDTKKSLAHAQENESEATTLSEKLKKYRAIKTKLQSDIMKEKCDGKKTLDGIEARIKSAQLANARDARLCKELNSGNAALTTNAQMLMSQLNDEHYGIDNAPTAQQLIEERNAREATPADEETGSHHPSQNSCNAALHEPSPHASDAPSYASSRRQSLSKPPLVASKSTPSHVSHDSVTHSPHESTPILA